jgi:hypothetical protein
LTSRNTISILITLTLASAVAFGRPSKITVGYAPGNVIRVVADSAVHAIYGLSYPVTYKLSLPAGSAQLSASRRYSTWDAWYTIAEKSSQDFFNSEEVVRFDYTAKCAYVSVPFGSASDTVYLRITDASGQAVTSQYLAICPYYDNRRAAVTISADDWEADFDEYFRYALSIFRGYHLWVSAGIITQAYWDSTTWNWIQQELDSGYVEAASHSRTHPLPPYADPVSEVAGSKQDILQNLNLPALFRNGSRSYVYAWIAPYGQHDRVIDSLVAVNHYLVSRTTFWPWISFSNWDSAREVFDTVGVTREMDPYWGADTNLVDLNNAFDATVASGGVYHLMCHPWALSEAGGWDRPYTLQHLSHISNRKDIWYVPVGLLYLYHFAAYFSAIDTITVNLKAYLQGPYSTLSHNMRTTLRQQGVLPLLQPYNVAPWSYGGTEAVASIPAGVVDWVLVELRPGTASSTKVATRAAFIKSNGSVVDLDAVSPVRFAGVPAGNYYIVVRHRNHLAIMSATPRALSGSSSLYDFTTAQSQAYGASPMKGLGTGNTAPFGLYAGDANADGQITSTDFNVFNPKFTLAATGYQASDWNLDGQVTSTDFNLFNPNFTSARSTQVP